MDRAAFSVSCNLFRDKVRLDLGIDIIMVSYTVFIVRDAGFVTDGMIPSSTCNPPWAFLRTVVSLTALLALLSASLILLRFCSTSSDPDRSMPVRNHAEDTSISTDGNTSAGIGLDKSLDEAAAAPFPASSVRCISVMTHSLIYRSSVLTPKCSSRSLFASLCV